MDNLEGIQPGRLVRGHVWGQVARQIQCHVLRQVQIQVWDVGWKQVENQVWWRLQWPISRQFLSQIRENMKHG
jgi:hypothetical protein